MTTKEGNELIAKFMNIQLTQEDIAHNWTLGDAPYDSDWNWMMNVVGKIEDLDPNERLSHMYSIDITGNGTTIQPNMWGGNDRWMIRHNSHNNRLHNTFLAVIDFIKWYNEKEK